MNYNKLFLWIGFQLIIFILGFFLQRNNDELSLLNQLQYSVFISRGAGLCLAITPMLLLLPMCRHTITLLRRYIPYTDNFLPDFSIYFHKICAYTIVFWAVIHMFGHFMNFYGVEQILKIETMFNLHYTIYGSVTGHLMMISLFFIFSVSGLYFRKFHFELFWLLHHFFIVMFLVYPFHGIGCFVKTNSNTCLPYYSNLIFSPVLIIYIIERLVRQFRPYIKIDDVSYFKGDVFKIKFNPNNLTYKPGQYLLLKCDKIDKIQWHPFTISSSPLDPYIEITIRSLGTWTEDFRSYLINNKNDLPLIQFDGNFGSPIDTILNYDSVILVASGIGITPYISMIKYLLQNTTKSFKIKKIDLIWINRNIEYFEWFNEELRFFEQNSSSLLLNFHMFLTEEINDISRIANISSQKIHHLNYIYKTDIPINYGRPNFDKFFNNYLNTNHLLTVGCFVCSSKPVEINVRNACKTHSNKNITLVFKSEKFN